MKDIFHKAGIEITSKNREEIDKLIHTIACVKYKSCPATWREVKKRIAENEEDFISTLKQQIVKKPQGSL